MTSIQWLIEQLQAPCKGIPSHIIEQAKKMYEEELRKENLKGYREGVESQSRYHPD